MPQHMRGDVGSIVADQGHGFVIIDEGIILERGGQEISVQQAG
jgi:hypothetical protein